MVPAVQQKPFHSVCSVLLQQLWFSVAVTFDPNVNKFCMIITPYQAVYHCINKNGTEKTKQKVDFSGLNNLKKYGNIAINE